VYTDETDRLVHIIEATPDGAGFSVLIERGTAAPKNEPLPGVGTRVGPWNARLGYRIVMVGPEECSRAQELKALLRSSAPPRVSRFLDWLSSLAQASDELECEVISDSNLRAWHCTPEEGLSLWQCIRRVAEKQVFRAAASSDPGALEDASWWLWRAAVVQEDIFLAAAGLERAGSPHAQMLLREGARSMKEEEKQLRFQRAKRRLEEEASRPNGHYAGLMEVRDKIRQRQAA
jgi:hypothetical protein